MDAQGGLSLVGRLCYFVDLPVALHMLFFIQNFLDFVVNQINIQVVPQHPPKKKNKWILGYAPGATHRAPWSYQTTWMHRLV